MERSDGTLIKRTEGTLFKRSDGTLIGEVNCVNCGRTLGEALQIPETGRLRLQPASHQTELQVELVDHRTLRCKRCLGRAFIERVLPRDIAPEAVAASDQPLAGAA